MILEILKGDRNVLCRPSSVYLRRHSVKAHPFCEEYSILLLIDCLKLLHASWLVAQLMTLNFHHHHHHYHHHDHWG